MANYYASARSNYFRVKDKALFLEECHAIQCNVVHEERDGKEYCALLFEEGIPSFTYNEDGFEEEDIDWREFFAKHLQEDSVAVLMESGAEKLRYIIGYAFAYNSEGDCLKIDLDDIYPKILETWGDAIETTSASY
jgi:hypothetical protein